MLATVTDPGGRQSGHAPSFVLAMDFATSNEEISVIYWEIFMKTIITPRLDDLSNTVL